ncbi:hypothetical protein, partial [Tamlana flava]|uniref:hypothetical protein n=1 Tax=Tamlana flava TaxID=3158572 RepID=UPI00351B1754
GKFMGERDNAAVARVAALTKAALSPSFCIFVLMTELRLAGRWQQFVFEIVGAYRTCLNEYIRNT